MIKKQEKMVKKDIIVPVLDAKLHLKTAIPASLGLHVDYPIDKHLQGTEISECGLYKKFTYILTYEVTERVKPKPSVLRYLAGKELLRNKYIRVWRGR